MKRGRCNATDQSSFEAPSSRPAGVMKHGYVGIANGRILSVSEKQPVIPGATFVNTEGIILPGFVDVQPRDLER